MGSSNKNVERIIKKESRETYEIYIYEENIEVKDKTHYIKVDENVILIHAFKLLNVLFLKDKMKIMFLSENGHYGNDKIGSDFLRTMTPKFLKEIFNNLYTTQNIIIFTI